MFLNICEFIGQADVAVTDETDEEEKPSPAPSDGTQSRRWPQL